MQSGLIDYDPTEGGYAITSGGNQQRTRSPVGYGPAMAASRTAQQGAQPQGLAATGEVAPIGPGQSRLDPLFATSAWTREDVLVISSVLSLVLTMALLYVRFNDGR